MTSPTLILHDATSAAKGLGGHPQDHGWRELHRLFAYGLKRGSRELTQLALKFRYSRPADSYSHLIMLLGIAVKEIAPGKLADLSDSIGPAELRLQELERILAEHLDEIEHILLHRQNSFTAARRFLIPQVLLSAYFAGYDSPYQVAFADLGTGLGVLPRQLNSRTLFGRFAPELVWPDSTPAFRSIPLKARFGMDRGPMPNLRWVHSCYGSSSYYESLYEELIFSLSLPEVQTAEVRYQELNILDAEELASFISANAINAVNVCYVLYELAPTARQQIIETLLRSLCPPGVIVITEPRAELSQQGATVTLYDQASSGPSFVCAVSDGHFRGSVVPLADYEAFVRRHPIH